VCHIFVASGGDYVAVTRQITFPVGQTTVPIPVMTSNDIISEQTEVFRAELSNPSGGVVLGGQRQATVNILDNDGNL